jgi:hypothetical protein
MFSKSFGTQMPSSLSLWTTRLLLNIASGFALTWLMAVCAIFCFVRVGNWLGIVGLATVAYAACIGMSYICIAWFHSQDRKVCIIS